GRWGVGGGGGGGGGAGHEGGGDRLGRLGPWIVRSDPDVVAEPRRDRAHEGPLAAVPVAATAEDDAEPPLRSDELPCRLERPLERVGSVRVVHDDEEGLSGLDTLEAAGNGADGAQRSADGL